MEQTAKKSRAAWRGEINERNDKEDEEEIKWGERGAGGKNCQVGKSGTWQEKRNYDAGVLKKTVFKGKSQAKKTEKKGSGAKAEIRRALSSRQYKGDVQLWLLQEHLTSDAFNIHRLPPGIISKLADGRCWRGEGAGFPGEVSTYVTFPSSHLRTLTSSPTYAVVCVWVMSGCRKNSLC